MDKPNDKVPYWARKSREDYESELKKIMEQQRFSEKKKYHVPPPKWNEPVWEQVAHELVYVIGLLEEEPTYPKNWRKVFRVLRTYEQLCRDSNHD